MCLHWDVMNGWGEGLSAKADSKVWLRLTFPMRSERAQECDGGIFIYFERGSSKNLAEVMFDEKILS